MQKYWNCYVAMEHFNYFRLKFTHQMTFRRIHLIFFMAFTFIALNSSPIKHLGIKGENASAIAIYIEDLRSGKAVTDINSEMTLTPASIIKSLTSATALCMLGPEFRFSTKVTRNGNHITIIPSGDPTLESQHFPEYAGFIDSITKYFPINGQNIAIDTKHQTSTQGPLPIWDIEDVAWDYGVGWFYFNWRDNTYTLYPNTGETSPKIPGLKYNLEISDTSSTNLLRGIGSDSLSIIVNRKKLFQKNFHIKSSMWNPSEVFLSEISKRHISIDTVHNPKMIYMHSSPCLKDILKSMMHRSDNMMAEGVLRALSINCRLDSSLIKQQQFWIDRLPYAEFNTIRDGSGLARSNRISPKFLAGILRYMAKSDLATDYTDIFPICGQDGTVRTFLKNTWLEGHVALKSGSMSGVQCYAGYKLDNNGIPTHSIVVMVNGIYCPRTDLRKAIERFLLNVFTRN